MRITEGRLTERDCPDCGGLERRAFGECESERGELASYALAPPDDGPGRRPPAVPSLARPRSRPEPARRARSRGRTDRGAAQAARRLEARRLL